MQGWPGVVFLQDFTLRVHESQRAVGIGILLHLAINDELHAGLIDTPQIRLVEKLDPHTPFPVPDKYLEY